ncbi:MAG: DNA-packaging protein [Clostridia bacterium]|nr:DNA-packaging protein [Clostridia bacterium]
MPILDDVKLAVREDNDAFNAEISDIIEAAKFDLKGSGVVLIDDTDPLIKRAIILYSKANYGLFNPDMEKYQKAYDMLKAHLSFSSDYNGYIEEEVI